MDIIVKMLAIKPPNYKHCPFCGKRLNIKTEEGEKRKFCNSCNWTYYPHVAGAVGAVIAKKGKVLMVQRKREPYKGTWMFPAGFIDYGEHPKETLEREVKEETGLRLVKAELIDVLQSEDDYRSLGHFCFFYRVEVKNGEIKTDEEENSDIKWFDLKKLPKIGWKGHQVMMRRLLGEKN